MSFHSLRTGRGPEERHENPLLIITEYRAGLSIGKCAGHACV